ncbi:MAG: response regulator [Candidatus Aureabacteria bacterium]|nr:response regulator [Candidatus Auribacterota bacterium]
MDEKKKILLICKDNETSEKIKEIISKQNIDVTINLDEKEALNIFREVFYDIVIFEWFAGKTSGEDFLKDLKKQDEDAVIILLVDEKNIRELRPAIKTGITDILLKPLDQSIVAASVQDIIHLRKEKIEKRKYSQELERYIDETTEMLKLQKEALEREQERSQGIIRDAHFGIVFLDGESEEVFMLNRRGRELFHLLDEFEKTFFSKNFREIFPEMIVRRIEDAVRRVKQEKTVIDMGEFVDEEAILGYVAYPIMIENMVSSIVVIADDITEKKTMERQLLQSSRLAGIGELAAGVAHEINNPVAFVMSNTRMLEKYFKKISELLEKYKEIEWNISSIEETEQRKKLIEEVVELKEKLKIDKALKNIHEIINENVDGLERVKKIVFDLKTFSHMDKTEMEKADINKIIDDTVNLVWNELKYKAEVVRELKEVPSIECFPQQISQVVANILVNAVHAIPDKGIITIRSYEIKDGVGIEISDTGVGMNEETLKKIFNPFFTTKESDKGTGLGLSIVFRIVEKHNGTVKVESEIGKGTTFIINLPISQEKARGIRTEQQLKSSGE